MINLLQAKQKPCILLFFISGFYFSLGTVLIFISEVIYSIRYPYH